LSETNTYSHQIYRINMTGFQL